MKVYTFADTARRIGCKARDISDLLYSRHLDESRLVPLGNGRRLVPEDYIGELRGLLAERGKIRGELVA